MAVQPLAALKTPVRIPQREYEEEMRLPSAGGTGDGGHRCRCDVLGALLSYVLYGLDWATTKVKTTRTRHATHRSAVPAVEGDAEEGRWRGPHQRAPGRTYEPGLDPPTTTSATQGAYH